MRRNIFSFQQALVLIGVLLTTGLASAQRANSLYFLEQTPFHNQWNPAMPTKYSGFGLGLSSISMSIKSDLAFSDLFTPSSDGSELYSFLHPSVNKNDFVNGLKDLTCIGLSYSMDVLNIGVRVKDSYFSFHSGLSLDAGAGIPKDVFRMFLLGMDQDKASTTFNLTDMNIHAMAYAKTGIGYSRKIGSIFTAGINANYLQGLADMRMEFDRLTVDATQTQWDVTSNGYIQMAVPADLAEFQYNENGYFDGIESAENSSFSSQKAGSGFSVDLGVTAKPLHFLTLSAALIDLGSISWDAANIQRAEADNSYTYDGMALNDEAESSMPDATDDFEDLIHFEKGSPKAYKTRLTSKLNIGAEAGILKDHITFGLLSQTAFAENETYQDITLSTNFKPSGSFQTALTYSLLHGKMSSFGAAMTTKILIFNFFAAADYIPIKYSAQMIPLDNSYFNMQFGLNLLF